MSRFIRIPALAIGRKGKWLLTEELQYYSSRLDKVIVVPEIFETDLASIPPYLTWLVPKNGKHRAAAIVHDHLYVQHGKVGGATLTRAECDAIFLEAMVVLGVSKWRRKIMYYAVRSGGWYGWKYS